MSIIIDDTNDASMLTHEEDVMETSVISQALNKVNPLYATIWWRPSFQDLNLRNNCVPAKFTFITGVWFIKRVDKKR